MKKYFNRKLFLIILVLIPLLNGPVLVDAYYDDYGYYDSYDYGYDSYGYDSYGYDSYNYYDSYGYDSYDYGYDNYYDSYDYGSGYYDSYDYGYDSYNYYDSYDYYGADSYNYDNYNYYDSYDYYGNDTYDYYDNYGYYDDYGYDNYYDGYYDGYNNYGGSNYYDNYGYYDDYGYGNDGYYDGYNQYGYDQYGYNQYGYNQGGYNQYGYNNQGYNNQGYNNQGYNRQGYNQYGNCGGGSCQPPMPPIMPPAPVPQPPIVIPTVINCTVTGTCPTPPPPPVPPAKDCLKCYDNDVYWYSASNVRKAKYQECGSDYCDAWGNTYKIGGQTYQQRTCYDKGCANGACYTNSNVETKVVNTCAAKLTIIDVKTEVEYGCPWGTGCGSSVGKRVRTMFKYSTGCDEYWGEWTNWTSWVVTDSCSSTETCSPGVSQCSYNANCVVTPIIQPIIQPIVKGITTDSCGGGLSIKILGKREVNLKEWNDEFDANGDDRIDFLIVVTNTTSNKIDDVMVEVDLPSEIDYKGDLNSEGEDYSGKITKGIDIGDMEADEIKVITFKGKIDSDEVDEDDELYVEAFVEADELTASDSMTIFIEQLTNTADTGWNLSAALKSLALLFLVILIIALSFFIFRKITS